jgi:hypothetical protein
VNPSKESAQRWQAHRLIERRRLRDLARGGKATIHDAPKCRYCLCLSIKVIFEEAGLVKRRRIRIAFSVITCFVYPINGLSRIHQHKKTGWIQKWGARVVQDSKFVGFDPDYDILLAKS